MVNDRDTAASLDDFKVHLSFYVQMIVNEHPLAIHPGEWTGIIVPQVNCGRYRVDFLAGAIFYDRAEIFPIQILAIECDGHDFHERTKAQAAYDRAKDRALQQMGMAVFRFTGSQLNADASSCHHETTRFFDRWAKEMEQR